MTKLVIRAGRAFVTAYRATSPIGAYVRLGARDDALVFASRDDATATIDTIRAAGVVGAAAFRIVPMPRKP